MNRDSHNNFATTCVTPSLATHKLAEIFHQMSFCIFLCLFLSEKKKTRVVLLADDGSKFVDFVYVSVFYGSLNKIAFEVKKSKINEKIRNARHRLNMKLQNFVIYFSFADFGVLFFPYFSFPFVKYVFNMLYLQWVLFAAAIL